MDLLAEVTIPTASSAEGAVVSKLQALPFTTNFNDQAPVNSYFITHEEDSSGLLTAHFRGRELKGKVFEVPSNMTGAVFAFIILSSTHILSFG